MPPHFHFLWVLGTPSPKGRPSYERPKDSIARLGSREETQGKQREPPPLSSQTLYPEEVGGSWLESAFLPPLSLLFALRSPRIQAECVFQLPGLSAFTPKLLPLQSFGILNRCLVQRLLLLCSCFPVAWRTCQHAVPWL